MSMFTLPRLLTRFCANHPLGRRCIMLSAPKVARFRNKDFDSLRRAVDRNLEAKKIYEQRGVELRPPHHLWRAFAFFIGTGLATFSCASIVEYQNARKRLNSFIDDTIAEFKRIYFGQPVKLGMDEAVATLIALNCAVFFMWRIVRMQPFMTRYFTNGLASKSLCWPMLLSVFSHNYLLHLAVNMYVLHSFSIGAIGFLGREQFLAFYITGGVFASLFSLCEKRLTRSLLPSLGASGAIAALIGYICTMVPDENISLIFLPQWTFSAENALYGMVAFEVTMMVVGLLTRFRFFDNAAHLGGLSFGIWYASRGEEWYRRWFMPKVLHCWTMSGIAPPNRTPVVVYDGKKHIHTTMDKVESGGDLVENEKETERKRRHLDWAQYRQKKMREEKERKMHILRMRQQNGDEGEGEDEEDGENEEDS